MAPTELTSAKSTFSTSGAIKSLFDAKVSGIKVCAARPRARGGGMGARRAARPARAVEIAGRPAAGGRAGRVTPPPARCSRQRSGADAHRAALRAGPRRRRRRRRRRAGAVAFAPPIRAAAAARGGGRRLAAAAGAAHSDAAVVRRPLKPPQQPRRSRKWPPSPSLRRRGRPAGQQPALSPTTPNTQATGQALPLPPQQRRLHRPGRRPLEARVRCGQQGARRRAAAVLKKRCNGPSPPQRSPRRQRSSCAHAHTRSP